MKEQTLNKILKVVREMMATGSTASAAGFSGAADPKGPTAGFDPLLSIKKKKKNTEKKRCLNKIQN